MRGREVWTRRRLWVGVGCAALVVLAVTLRRVGGEQGEQAQYDGPAFVVSVVGVLVSVAALLLDVLRRTDAPPEPGVVLRQTADALAEAVRVQWSQEARLRRLQDPKPLNVRWTRADRLLTDDTRNIRRGRPVPEPRPGDNCLASIATTFEDVPSRRMVVLGSPGSGKSVLAVCCTLDLLKKRTPGTAVPVIFPLAAWDPGTTTLRAWLVERLVAEYRPLAATTDGTVLAGALLDAGLITPVLDGFDELPPALYGIGMRRLNAELDDGMPVLVTSRTTAWRSTVECSDVLTGAEVLELLPLDFAEAKSYLERTARPLRGPSDRRTTVWTPVLDSLQEDARSPAARALLRILTNPLMVALARTVLAGDPEAEDLVQEAFVHAWQRLGSLRKPESFPAWMRRIVVRRCLRWARRNPPREELRDSGAPGPGEERLDVLRTERVLGVGDDTPDFGKRLIGMSKFSACHSCPQTRPQNLLGLRSGPWRAPKEAVARPSGCP